LLLATRQRTVACTHEHASPSSSTRFLLRKKALRARTAAASRKRGLGCAELAMEQERKAYEVDVAVFDE
jgi:hypothetical protein